LDIGLGEWPAYHYLLAVGESHLPLQSECLAANV
jgi:hypothetical protein